MLLALLLVTTASAEHNAIGKDFIDFAAAWQAAIAKEDTAWIVAHTQFPLPILTRGFNEGNDGKMAFIDGTSMRTVTAEAWSKPMNCEGAQMDDFTLIQNVPTWRCDFTQYLGHTDKAANTYAPDPISFTLSYGKGRDLRRAEEHATLHFDKIDGTWKLRRIEYVHFSI